MKVLNLRCSHGHDFEGWFASEDDFQSQQTRGLLSCPLCADPVVSKMLSAPRLNLGHAREPAATPTPQVATEQAGTPAVLAQQQGALMRAMRELLGKVEDVGERFADEARAMHHGEVEQRDIRGRTSVEEAMELLDEGIDLLPLPDLAAMKETLH